MTPRCLSSRGHTLLESAVVVSLFSAGLLGTFAVLDRGTHFSDRAVHAVVADSGAHRALEGFLDVVEESSIDLVDTTQRVTSASSFSTWSMSSDRFYNYEFNLRQCSSATCGFHTRNDLSIVESRYLCGFEYLSGQGVQPVVRGKVLPSSMTRCPFDGATCLQGAALDGIKLFVARSTDGTFSTDGGSGPEPDWTGIVFFFPYSEGESLPELRRYEVHIADLLALPPLFSPAWSRWSPLAPTMTDLFDFGTDGTTNGVPDGSVPVTAAACDASSEVFYVSQVYGEPAIIFTKNLTTSGSFPSRDLQLVIRLRDGMTTFSVSHYDSLTSFWSAYRTFTREPRTIVTGLTEFAVSTAASNPWDAVANPTGVEGAGVVRITVGTSSAAQNKGHLEWTHQVDTFALKPRN